MRFSCVYYHNNNRNYDRIQIFLNIGGLLKTLYEKRGTTQTYPAGNKPP
jgi:glutathionyl-hydroquinone reductase